MTQPVRVLFWVQHLLGIGHLSRAATLARAMTADGMEVLVASGGEPSPVTDTGAAKLAQLPSARAVDIYFKVLYDENDQKIDDACSDGAWCLSAGAELSLHNGCRHSSKQGIPKSN